MNILRFGKRLRSDENGATAIEYGLLAALIAVAIIASLRLVSDQLQDTFGNVTTELTSANTTPVEEE